MQRIDEHIFIFDLQRHAAYKLYVGWGLLCSNDGRSTGMLSMIAAKNCIRLPSLKEKQYFSRNNSILTKSNIMGVGKFNRIIYILCVI